MIFDFRQRSKKHFQELTNPHIQLLYNMALRYCGNTFDAEDILQETMFIAFKNWRQLKDETKCKAWLLTILRRNFLKEVRQNISQSLSSEDISCLQLMERHITSDHSLTMETQERAEAVRKCLADLPENYQTPTLLYYMDDMTYQDIADTLAMPIGTVMSRLSRAKQMLKKKLLQQAMQKESGVIVPFNHHPAKKKQQQRRQQI